MLVEGYYASSLVPRRSLSPPLRTPGYEATMPVAHCVHILNNNITAVQCTYILAACKLGRLPPTHAGLTLSCV